ncbi:integrase, catalytic region, zinc finger, CCHC-type containing protein [Tanacetum coccineum]
MVIKKLKERIKSLSGNMDKDKIKQDLEEIETINIELDHRVTKLIAENEHLKQTYKQLYDSIKPARVRSKEQCADLTNQVNLKSMEISDLNACLQKKVCDPEINTEPITPKLLNKRSAHSTYIKHTQEEAAVLRDLVDHIKANYSLDPTLESSFKFGNDHAEKILGYGDYHIGNVTISRVYYVEGPGHNLFSVRQFCDSNLEVAFRQHTCFIRNLEGDDLLIRYRGNNLYTLSLRDMMTSSPICLLSKCSKTKSWLWHRLPVRHIRTDNGTEFVNQTLREYYEKVGISHETSVARSQQQNGVIERRNHTLIEAARTMLIYTKALLFLWAEAVATACYTQNRSIICLRHRKTPYELLHDKLPDLSFFHVFGALCYPTNDSENLGKSQPKADICIFIGYAPTKKAFLNYNRRTRRIIETIHVDFDELTVMASKHSSSGPALHEMTLATITPEVVALIDEVAAPVPAVSTGAPSSTTVDQDAPSPSNSQTTPDTQPPVIPNDVEEDNHDIEVAYMGNDLYFGILIPEVPSDQSSSLDSINTNVPPDH